LHITTISSDRKRGEIGLVKSIGRRAKQVSRAELRLGIGDDCAVYRPRGARQDLLFTTDLLLEGVHFRTETHRAEDVGHKALARGLSDIAAMGGAPQFCLVSLSLAPSTSDRWLDGFYRGLMRLAERYSTALAGGDLARSRVLGCDIVVCGAVPRGQALRRDGARPGDAIYVSGRLGGSALGLKTRRGAAWQRHLRPQPRVELGGFLREKLRATAAMDLSDGLSLDLHRLCLASALRADIEEPPRFRGASIEQALHGGEDYELLFTLSPRVRPPPRFNGVPLTPIGFMRKGRAGEVRLDGRPLDRLGYDHFRDSPVSSRLRKKKADTFSGR
jgi:thiamine-monophosphate kinase